jgi:hypothetical protein
VSREGRWDREDLFVGVKVKRLERQSAYRWDAGSVRGSGLPVGV